jgi:hypothetical protein
MDGTAGRLPLLEPVLQSVVALKNQAIRKRSVKDHFFYVSSFCGEAFCGDKRGLTMLPGAWQLGLT